MSNPSKVFFDMNTVNQDSSKQSLTSNTQKRLVRWISVSLLTILSPLLLPLLWLWWLLSSPRLAVLLELGIISFTYFSTLLKEGVILQSYFFEQSVLDVVVLSFFRGLVVLGFLHRTPEKAYPSWKRRVISLVCTFVITIALVLKYRAVSGPEQVIILTSLIGSIITCLSEHWILTSLSHLLQAEEALLSSAGVQLEGTSDASPTLIRKFAGGISYFESVEIEEIAIVDTDSNGCIVRKRGASQEKRDAAASQFTSKPPLVLTHGYGAGKAIWASIIPELQKTFHLYILDWNGIGMSSRPKFSARRLSQAEGFFVDSLENWRIAVGLDRFFLCGHSLGGYLASIYALRHPERIQQLLLLSPVVGVPKDLEEAEKTPFSLFTKIFCFLWDYITPMCFIRFLGPLSFIITDKLIRFRFGDTVKGCEIGKLAAYLYHLAAGPPSGELALPLILAPGAHPRRPLSPLLGSINLPTVFVYGEHDWMDAAGGKEAVQFLQEKQRDAKYLILPDAGHQLMFENPQGLSRIMVEVTAAYM